MRHLAFLLLLTLCFSGIFSEGYTQPQKFKINSVRIEGNEKADTSIIMINSGLRPGKQFTSDDIQKAVKNLWALKLFSDIKIFVEKQTFNGLDLLIKLEEFPRLEGWVIEGNDKLKKKDILLHVTVKNAQN